MARRILRGGGTSPDTTSDGRRVAVQLEPADDPRWHRFAMRIALGASVADASRAAGVARSTGYEWLHLEGVQRLVGRYGEEAATRARRELAGLVREAVRTIRALLKDASAKGSPTRLAAAQLVLEWNRIESVPQAVSRQRLLTYIPRPDRDPQAPALPDPAPAQPPPDTPGTAPHDPGALPPDFPRLPDGSVDLVALARVGDDLLARLTDPDTYRR